jgi:hypothetical protein
MGKELIREVRPYVRLYRDPKTGIAWVEDGSTGMGHTAHPNISATGSVRGMKSLGHWPKSARTVRSHGWIYNIDSCVVSNGLDKIARDACRCGGNHDCGDDARSGAHYGDVERTKRGRFTGKQTPAPNPGMNPFAPQARVRIDDQWRIGDIGAVYEFNVKLHRVESDAPDAVWEQEVWTALDQFKQELRRKYPWIGDMDLTGRSDGWLAIEDPKGKMTKAKLETIAKLVEAGKRQFVKDMEQAYPRRRQAR